MHNLKKTMMRRMAGKIFGNIAPLLLVAICSACLSINKDVIGAYEFRDNNLKELVGNVTMNQDSIYEQTFFKDSTKVICGRWSKIGDTIILTEQSKDIEPKSYIIRGRKLYESLDDNLISKDAKLRKISRKVKMLPFTCYHECYAYFNAYTEQAENHFQNGELTTARLFYQRALELKCAYAGHGALLSRINEIDAFLNKKIAAEESYKHLLEEAQKKFDKKDYLEALRLYKEANMIRPTAPLPRLRIDEINHILK